MHFAVAMISSPGGRKNNQDALDYTMLDEMGCFALADGLGGHKGGEIASLTAVDGFLDAFEDDPAVDPEALRRYLLEAHQAVMSRQEEDPRFKRMRTTLVGLALGQGMAVWGHVGDSRLYHLRGGRILFQTKDQSVPQAMVAAGEIGPEQIRGHEDRNRLLRALGKGENFKPLVLKQVETIRPGDVFLLCTDGLWEYVLESDMETTLAASGAKDAPALENWLWAMEGLVLERATGEFDNYSALAVSVLE